jgi:uncharacterized metal-binding protein YceD (DUF177 family)
MKDVAPEFSRLVPLVRLGPEPFRQRIEATPDEREQLCRRFELLSLDRLAAAVELHRESGGIIRMEAAFEAEFVQICAVTLDPVPGEISDRFALIYGPPQEPEQEITLTGDEPAFEPLSGDTIDIGEAVAQELSLALPVFPRHTDAALDEAATAAPLEGPLASLARLRKSTKC